MCLFKSHSGLELGITMRLLVSHQPPTTNLHAASLFLYLHIININCIAKFGAAGLLAHHLLH